VKKAISVVGTFLLTCVGTNSRADEYACPQLTCPARFFWISICKWERPSGWLWELRSETFGALRSTAPTASARIDARRARRGYEWPDSLRGLGFNPKARTPSG